MKLLGSQSEQFSCRNCGSTDVIKKMVAAAAENGRVVAVTTDLEGDGNSRREILGYNTGPVVLGDLPPFAISNVYGNVQVLSAPVDGSGLPQQLGGSNSLIGLTNEVGHMTLSQAHAQQPAFANPNTHMLQNIEQQPPSATGSGRRRHRRPRRRHRRKSMTTSTETENSGDSTEPFIWGRRGSSSPGSAQEVSSAMEGSSLPQVCESLSLLEAPGANPQQRATIQGTDKVVESRERFFWVRRGSSSYVSKQEDSGATIGRTQQPVHESLRLRRPVFSDKKQRRF